MGNHSPINWEPILRRYQSSNLTQAAFCEREGIKLHQLHYQLQKQNTKKSFLPIVVPTESNEGQSAPSSAARVMEIALPGGTVVRIPL